MDVDILPTQ